MLSFLCNNNVVPNNNVVVFSTIMLSNNELKKIENSNNVSETFLLNGNLSWHWLDQISLESVGVDTTFFRFRTRNMPPTAVGNVSTRNLEILEIHQDSIFLKIYKYKDN